MTDTPKKTLTLKRKTTGAGSKSGTVSRSGKRIIRRDELPRARPAKAPKAPPKKPTKQKKKPARVSKPKMAVSPSDLKARELNDRLNAFPAWLNYQPLAIGVDKEIFRLVNDECFPGASKKVVQKVLRMHTGHGRYLQALGKGGGRFSLDGTECGVVDSYQMELATKRLTERS
ncbi:MAG: Fertility inhibition FinO [Thiotrichales bacterium]|nr:MAG: Fertility inhibition FinO [Thiotrichales bacterium]